MKLKILATFAVFIFTLTLFQTANAQTAKESTLIAHLVKEANQPGSHSNGDVYLSVTIGKTAYIAALKSGKIVSKSNAEYASGGFSGAYAEVQVNLLNANKEETAQGAGQILKLTGNKWKRIALNETDYQCNDVKTVPKSVLKALKVECN